MKNEKYKIILESISDTTSPLRWAGGKRFIASEIKTILKHTDSDDTLIEVFGGSLALTFAIQPRKSIVNDLLTPLTNMFERIKNGELLSAKDIIDATNSKENFLKNRSQFNSINRGETPNTLKEAALFYFLNRTCYNGLCRFSCKTGFNVGWGKLKKPLILESFEEHRNALCRTTINNESYKDFKVSTKGLIILDPPYFGVFTGYAGNGFTLDDQQLLSDMYKSVENPVIAFNSDDPEILKIYQDNGYDVYTYDAPRKISCDGNRQNVREMMAVRNISPSLIKTIMKEKMIKCFHKTSV